MNTNEALAAMMGMSIGNVLGKRADLIKYNKTAAFAVTALSLGYIIYASTQNVSAEDMKALAAWVGLGIIISNLVERL